MLLFENESTKASFYFAAEEYIMRYLQPQEEVLMLWHTGDTVMIGANQIADAERDGAYAKENNIVLVRRPSGGGAIYTDRGTLQFSIILPYRQGDDVTSVTRDWLAGPVIETVGRFGAGAAMKGRNDIVINDKKISGMAQHIKGGYVSSHGSLLFNVDKEKLDRVLTVDREKIESKAISSTAARITNISEHIGEANLDVFREAFIESFEREGLSLHRTFKPEELKRIEQIMVEKYENDDWTYGREPAYTKTNKKRYSGGSIEIFLDVKGGVIQDVKIAGDFLSLRNIAPLEDALKDVPYREETVREALREVSVNVYLGSLGEAELLETMFGG